MFTGDQRESRSGRACPDCGFIWWRVFEDFSPAGRQVIVCVCLCVQGGFVDVLVITCVYLCCSLVLFFHSTNNKHRWIDIITVLIDSHSKTSYLHLFSDFIDVSSLVLLTCLLIMVILSYITVTIPISKMLQLGRWANHTIVTKPGAIFQICMWLFTYVAFIHLNSQNDEWRNMVFSRLSTFISKT